MPPDEKVVKQEFSERDMIADMLKSHRVISDLKKTVTESQRGQMLTNYENFRENPVWQVLVQDLRSEIADQQEDYFDDEECRTDTEKRKMEYLIISIYREVVKGIIFRVDDTINDLKARIKRNVSKNI